MIKPKPYLSYRNSGDAWLGQVPSHWSVLRGSAFLCEKKRKNESLQSENYLSLMAGRGVIPYAEKGDVGNKKADDLSKCKIVEVGDFVVNSMNFSIGSYGVSKHHGICSPVYVVMSHNDEVAKPEFVDLILSNPSYQNYAQSFGTGILDHRRSIGWDEIKRIPVAVPPIDEQIKIATYAHQETARIDTLIAKKTRFIELLKEKRQAVITKAVTKGLDDSVEMRDSGEEWIGEIPKHWTSAGFNFVAQVTEGLVDPKEPLYRNMVLIAPNHIESGTGRLLAQETAAEQNAESGKYTCKEGAVIYSKIRPALAKVVIAPCDCLCSADMYPMSCSEKADPEWLFYLMLSTPFTAWAVLESDRVAMPKINRESLSGLRVFVPPIEEQKHMVGYVNTQLRRIDSLIEKTHRSIELLKEKRSALITAAVTGKIDVREAA